MILPSMTILNTARNLEPLLPYILFFLKLPMIILLINLGRYYTFSLSLRKPPKLLRFLWECASFLLILIVIDFLFLFTEVFFEDTIPNINIWTFIVLLFVGILSLIIIHRYRTKLQQNINIE